MTVLRKLGPVMMAMAVLWGCGGGDNRPVIAGGSGGTGGQGGSGGVGGIEVFGLDERPANPTCVAPASPPGPANVRLVRAFPGLSFDLPLDLVQAPGRPGRWYVVEKAGRILTFEDRDDASEATVALDITDRVESAAREAGLLGLAFHPDTGAAYVSYTGPASGGFPLVSVVSRFTSSDGGLTYDPASEAVVFTQNQPKDYHNGGHLVFGPDGYLYFGFGDGGDSINSPDMDTWLGKMLRVDVSEAGYTVPPDNPFVDTAAALPEIWALGLRNPWRFSFDSATGELWIADVGESAWEEVNLGVAGADYGWDDYEGFACNGETCDRPDRTDPIWVYSHDEGRAITGGFVYRGAALPALNGTYLFGDFVSGKIWGLTRPTGGGPPLVQMLLESGLTIASFGEASDGELYVVDHVGGALYRFAPESGASQAFPVRLSQTGCVDSLDPTRPASGMIPYDVITPLWSDAAQKDRYFAIPDGATIGVGPDGDWDLPIGSVAMKTFYLGGRRIETRYLVRHESGNWAGYTYEWNATGTDAFLLSDRKVVNVDGQDWTIPSRGDCIVCHTAAAGRTLGLELAQLNRSIRWPNGRDANLLDTIRHIGMFTSDPGPATGLPALATQPAGRAYLHANCSICHRPNGAGQGEADYRYTTPLAEMGVCDEVPQDDLGIPDARIVAPGAPERSVLSARMRALGVSRMPPLATSVIDADGTTLVDDWIRGLTGCTSE